MVMVRHPLESQLLHAARRDELIRIAGRACLARAAARLDTLGRLRGTVSRMLRRFTATRPAAHVPPLPIRAGGPS
jgi:hypothetical protein